MWRRVLIVVCAGAFCLSLGCGGEKEKNTNPNNLEYSKEGPPKRNGAPGDPTKGGK